MTEALQIPSHLPSDVDTERNDDDTKIVIPACRSIGHFAMAGRPEVRTQGGLSGICINVI